MDKKSEKESNKKSYNNLSALDLETVKKTSVKEKTKKTFKYIVKDSEGKVMVGYFDALSKLDCYTYLLDKGYTVYKIENGAMITFLHGQPTLFKNKIRTKDLIFWLTQLRTYLKSGIPLVDAVKLLAKENKNRRYKPIFESVIYELTMGENFSAALEKQGEFFPLLLINMIKSAEAIGDLDSTLNEMINYYETQENIKRDMVSAATYPSIVLVFSIAIISFILTYVIPKFVDVYESSGVEMNAFTSLVLSASNWMTDNYYWLFVILLILIFLFRLFYRKVKGFRKVIQIILMNLPIVGKIMIYNEISLFSRTFAALSKADVALTDSIEILSKITNNEIYKKIMKDTINNLIKGNKMSDTFKDNKYVPEVAYYMIVTGERTSELASMLEKVADFYKEQQKTMLMTLKNFIEPFMIAFLAFIVGAIILAVIVPMFGLYSNLE